MAALTSTSDFRYCLAILSVLALASCGAGLGGGAVIERFDSSETAVSVGSSVLLRWRVSDADRIEVVDEAGATLVNYRVAEGRISGDVEVRPTAKVTYTLLAHRGPKANKRHLTIDIRPAEREPVIVDFSANPEVVVAGESAMLSWETQFAHGVEIYADDTLLLSETEPFLVSASSFSVSPGISTTYRIEAGGYGGASQAQLDVSVIPMAVIESFAVDRDLLSAEESVQFTWQTQGADSVEIYDSGGGLVLNNTSAEVAARGSLDVRLTANGPYTLHAYNTFSSAQVGLEVEVVPLPEVVQFSLVDLDMQAGEAAQIEYSVLGAETITITDPSGAVVASTTVDTGLLSHITQSNGAYALTAANWLGGMTRAVSDIALVATAGPAMWTQPPSPVWESVARLAWSAPGAITAHVSPALGHQLVLGPPFASIEATGTELPLTPDSNLDVVPLGFDFLFDRVGYDVLTVSYRGYARFGTQSLEEPNSAGCRAPGLDVAHSTTSAVRWSSGRVFVGYTGVVPNRQAIIEWNQMVAGQSPLTISFQLIVNESGHMDYAYRIDTGTQGSTASARNIDIGFCSSSWSHTIAEKFWLENAFASAPYRIRIEPEDVLRSTEVPVSGSRLMAVWRYHSEWTFDADYGEGGRTLDFQIENPEAHITEVMYQPAFGAAQADGEWFEVQNVGEQPFDLEGWYIEVNGNRSAAIPENSLRIAPGEYAVLGTHGDQNLNGGVPVDYVYPRTAEMAMSLSSGGLGVQLLFGLADMSRMRRQLNVRNPIAMYIEPGITPKIQSGAGASVSIAPGCESMPGGCCYHELRYCLESAEIELGGNRGSPGVRNSPCAATGLFGSAAVLNGGLPLTIAQGQITSTSDMRDGAPSVFYALNVGEPAQVVAESMQSEDTQLILWSEDGAERLGATYASRTAVLKVSVEPGLYIIEENSLNGSSSGAGCGLSDLMVFLQEAPALPVVVGYSMAWGTAAFENIAGAPDAIDLPAVQLGATADLPLGFALPHFGAQVSIAHVHKNGVLRIGATAPTGKNLDLTDVDPTQGMTPENKARFGMIAAFWDNLVPKPTSTLTYTTRTDGETRFIMQWGDWDVYNNETTDHLDGATLSFQAVIYATGDIEFRYDTIVDGLTPDRGRGGSATVGIVGPVARIYPYQAAYLEPVLSSGTSLRFTANR